MEEEVPWWHVPYKRTHGWRNGTPPEQKTDNRSAVFDQLDGISVGHILGANAVDFNQLIADLEMKQKKELK